MQASGEVALDVRALRLMTTEGGGGGRLLTGAVGHASLATNDDIVVIIGIQGRDLGGGSVCGVGPASLGTNQNFAVAGADNNCVETGTNTTVVVDLGGGILD